MAIYGLYDKKKHFNNSKLATIDHMLEMRLGVDVSAVASDVNAVSEDVWYQRSAIGSQGDSARFSLLDGYAVVRNAPDLTILHSEMLTIVQHVSGMDVIPSPYIKSAVNVRRYRKGDTEGRHFDTQDLACVLFLTEGAPLVVEIDGQEIEVPCIPDRLVIFDGKHIRHRVPAVDWDQCRLSVPLNYSLRDNYARPSYIDRMLYQNMSYEDATR